jgi:hypothetical protein
VWENSSEPQLQQALRAVEFLSCQDITYHSTLKEDLELDPVPATVCESCQPCLGNRAYAWKRCCKLVAREQLTSEGRDNCYVDAESGVVLGDLDVHSLVSVGRGRCEVPYVGVVVLNEGIGSGNAVVLAEVGMIRGHLLVSRRLAVIGSKRDLDVVKANHTVIDGML